MPQRLHASRHPAGAAATQPPTVIFHLSARFNADTHPKKLNLGVGAYRDEDLKPVVFGAVRAAEAAVVAAKNNKEYLPVRSSLWRALVRSLAVIRRHRRVPQIVGLPAFTAAAGRLMFGADSAVIKENRLRTCQTLSGTGSLTVAAHLIKCVRCRVAAPWHQLVAPRLPTVPYTGARYRAVASSAASPPGRTTARSSPTWA